MADLRGPGPRRRPPRPRHGSSVGWAALPPRPRHGSSVRHVIARVAASAHEPFTSSPPRPGLARPSPRTRRGVAASPRAHRCRRVAADAVPPVPTRRHRISTWHPRRCRDPTPPNLHVASAAVCRAHRICARTRSLRGVRPPGRGRARFERREHGIGHGAARDDVARGRGDRDELGIRRSQRVRLARVAIPDDERPARLEEARGHALAHDSDLCRRSRVSPATRRLRGISSGRGVAATNVSAGNVRRSNRCSSCCGLRG